MDATGAVPSAGRPDLVVVMGVSGSGKTTVAQGLAAAMGWPFAEGDALHPPANVAKMHAGIPLTDEDRWPWLRVIGDTIFALGMFGVGWFVFGLRTGWSVKGPKPAPVEPRELAPASGR